MAKEVIQAPFSPFEQGCGTCGHPSRLHGLSGCQIQGCRCGASSFFNPRRL